MNNVWFTSDTHFGHKNILKYESEARPFETIEEMNEQLIKNWNSVVKKNDTIWHLGDVAFGQNTLDLIMPRLKGKYKRLVLGNHDCYDIKTYAKYFDKIFGVVFFKEFVLSHVPVISRLHNIHGHWHSKKLEDVNYTNVSVEQTNLTPINLDEIRSKLK